MNESLFILGLIFVFVSYMIFLAFIVKKQESRFNERLNGIVFNIHNNRKDAESEIKELNININRIGTAIYKIKHPPKYSTGKLTDNIIILSIEFIINNIDKQFCSGIHGYWEYEVFLINENKKMTKVDAGIEELLKEESENK